MVNYDIGDFSVAASYVDESQNTGGVEDLQIGVGYAINGWNLGAVYGNREGNFSTGQAFDQDYWLLSVDGKIGNFGVSAVIGENESNEFVDLGAGPVFVGGDDIAYGFGVNYDISAATNVSFVYSGGGIADIDGADDAVSIGFLHDLGSGATVRGFVGQNNAGSTVADFGVRFNF